MFDAIFHTRIVSANVLFNMKHAEGMVTVRKIVVEGQSDTFLTVGKDGDGPAFLFVELNWPISDRFLWQPLS